MKKLPKNFSILLLFLDQRNDWRPKLKKIPLFVCLLFKIVQNLFS